jgi:hypothetical protein
VEQGRDEDAAPAALNIGVTMIDGDHGDQVRGK